MKRRWSCHYASSGSEPSQVPNATILMNSYRFFELFSHFIHNLLLLFPPLRSGKCVDQLKAVKICLKEQEFSLIQQLENSAIQRMYFAAKTVKRCSHREKFALSNRVKLPSASVMQRIEYKKCNTPRRESPSVKQGRLAEV